ncbi:hypothetical protein HY380_02210 [Candidatus Saccharibacteria bacterium]|nr:hypothetical protein [Candidatus Saccharibacteria bacterium]
MSHTLTAALGESETLIKPLLTKLETLTGRPSEDLRLLSEMKQLARHKMTQLGLDPNDTTAEELHHSLKLKYANDCQSFDQAINLEAGADFSLRFKKLTAVIRQAIGQAEVWALKPAAGRQLLKSLPPKKLMKLLGYRSLESMLKRQPLAAILISAPFCEPISWQADFKRQLTKLSSSSYGLQPAKIIELPAKLGQLKGPDNGVAASQLVAAVGLWPAEANTESANLSLYLTLASGLEEIGAVLDDQALAKLDPSLSWWQETEHLLHIDQAGIGSSFNLRDVALNHQQRRDFSRSSQSHGRQQLWRELINRYERYSAATAEIVPEIESKVGARLSPGLPMPQQLAMETVEA